MFYIYILYIFDVLLTFIKTKMKLSKRKFIKDLKGRGQMIAMIESKFEKQLIKIESDINSKGFLYWNFYLVKNEAQLPFEGTLIAQYNNYNPGKSWYKTI